jgi:hypothetical protein
VTIGYNDLDMYGFFSWVCMLVCIILISSAAYNPDLLAELCMDTCSLVCGLLLLNEKPTGPAFRLGLLVIKSQPGPKISV